MKNILLVSLVALLLFASCEKLENYNENPNNVSETHPQLLLNTIEWRAFQVEGAAPLFASRMIVQTDGEEAEQYYKWDRGSFGSYGVLRDVTKMMEEAERIESNNYQALARFFRAYYFYNLTLVFGDIPYSQALKGESNQIYAPAYDQQKDLFIGILQELEEASDMMNDDLIDGDIIFNGNPQKWKKLINSFRLKVLLTLSKKTADSDLDVAGSFAGIVANETLMESIDDNGQLVFIDQLGNRYTEYNSSSYGSARYMDSTFIQRLQDREDPRLFIYCGQTRNAKEAGLPINDFSAYEGGNPIAPYNEVNLKAAAGNVSKVNLRYTTDPTCEPHMLMGYHELQFILAEARIKGWIDDADAETYYEKGIEASFEFYYEYSKELSEYVSETALNEYLTHPLVDLSTASGDEERLERIIMQKYLASFLQGGWSMYYEHLRTGYPAFSYLPTLTPPARWMYPNSEYQLNSKNVSDAITRQFGADNDNIRETTWWLQ
ncbi:MAG: SusD/RagB family nutrient-binding outer membrane lipoprotein [Bacteroidales bacterium]|nr:SusD/RagB family nutrient-binding outer membrane lipoprotein [Bacteroidales bacterium]